MGVPANGRPNEWACRHRFSLGAAALEGSRFVGKPLCRLASSIGWQQAAPGNYPARRFAQRVWFDPVLADVLETPATMADPGSFAGAPCCQPIELPS